MARKRRVKRPPEGLDVTPEFMARHGADLVPAGIQGKVGGKTVHTTYRVKSPIERIRSLEPHEILAGNELHRLFIVSNIESVGAVDCARAVVDTSTVDHTTDHVLDARSNLNAALKIIPPLTMQIIDDIVLHEIPVMEFCNKRRCDRKAAVAVLRVGLEMLAIHFGYYSKSRKSVLTSGHKSVLYLR